MTCGRYVNKNFKSWSAHENAPKANFEDNRPITCKFMNKKKSKDALQCPIYFAMKQKYDFSDEHLQHLQEFTHFGSEMVQKPACKNHNQCRAYIRCENGGYRLDDRCHLKLYRHPPRQRNIRLAQNIHSMIMNENPHRNAALYKPTGGDCKKGFYLRDGYLWALIAEVIANGFKNDLCTECGPNDDCKHDEHSILEIVDQKVDAFVRKKTGFISRDEVLALLLYTGCDCNYDLCKSQRSGDYKKWKFFDYCLYNAIRRLALMEYDYLNRNTVRVFSGLGGVQLDRKVVRRGYFVTYTSTSWNKDVAMSFIGNKNGMLIEFDENYKDSAFIYGCDVSWFSKFPDECEILFARSVGADMCSELAHFECAVVDETNGVQTVSLRYHQTQEEK